MGSSATPLFARIVRDKFENTYIYPEIKNDSLLYSE